MSYQPEPTSVAARVIKYLGAKPAGYVASSAELSRQLGVPSTSFHGCLTASMNAGLVAKRNLDELGRFVGFALGHVTAQFMRPGEEPVHEAVQTFTTAHAPVAPPAQDAPQADPVTEEIKALLDSVEDDPAFACALFNDGRLYLELGGESMTLQVQHTRALLAYLERVALP